MGCVSGRWVEVTTRRREGTEGLTCCADRRSGAVRSSPERSGAVRSGRAGAGPQVRGWLSSDDAGRPPTTVVPAVVLPGQVGGSHEHEALIRAAVLEQHVDALLAGGLPGIGQCRVPVGVASHDVHPVL